MGTGQNTKKSKVTVDNGEHKNWKGERERERETKKRQDNKRTEKAFH